MTNRARLNLGDPDDSAQYQLDRLAWRQSLSDIDVRSFAADYMRGIVDESTYDGYLEYMTRFKPKRKPGFGRSGSDGPMRPYYSRKRAKKGD